MKNITKKPNNCFIKFQCFLCLDTFEGEEEIFEMKNIPSEVVCYDCANKSEDDVRKKLIKKASHYSSHFQRAMNDL